MRHGYIKVAAATPAIRVADPAYNAAACAALAETAADAGVKLLVFPELCLTGYTCGDLFLQETLLGGAEKALRVIADYTAKYPGLTAIVGAPLQLGVSLFNCGVVISGGYIRGIVPKTFLCNEMDEGRWFVPASVLKVTSVNMGYEIPVGTDLLFALADGTKFGVEICEDLWRPISPSVKLAHAGAEVIVNLSASNETVGKRAIRRELVR